MCHQPHDDLKGGPDRWAPGTFPTVTQLIIETNLPLCAAYIGALAYLGPKAGRDVFSISGETADLVFGAVTVPDGSFWDTGWRCGARQIRRHHGQWPDALRGGHASWVSS